MNILHAAFDHPSVRTFAQICAERAEEHVWLIHAESEHRAEELRSFWNAFDSEVIVGGVLPSAAVLQANWSLAVCHNAFHPTITWIEALEHPGHITWVAWGADYYQSYPSLQKGLFLPYTRWVNVAILKVFYRYQRSRLAPLLTPKLAANLEQRRRFISSASSCSTLLGDALPCLPFMATDVRILASWYNTIPPRMLAIEPAEHRSGILFGNSGSNTGNHLDGLLRLRGKATAGMELRPILAYGDKRYTLVMNVFGRLFFGTRWRPVKKRLPFQAYGEMLSQRKFAVFYNTRSQAASNVILLLYFKCIVFLHPRNPMLSALKKMGFHVHSTDLIGDDALPQFQEHELEHNRELARKTFSVDAVNQSLNELINSL